MTATPEESTPDARDGSAATMCERARDLAEGHDLEGAAAEFQRVLAAGETHYRGEAAFGLGAVRDAQGDVEGAREAYLLAWHTNDPDHAPRAGYNLAVSYERSGERDDARATWQAVVDAGNERYLPGALCGLADIAADECDSESAAELWRRAVATGDRGYAPLAAYNLGTQLMLRGEYAAAQEAFAAAVADDPAGEARVSLGVVHLERAIASFRDALACADADVFPLAAELLARSLPLRGAYDEAERTWGQGLAHSDPDIARAVRARLRRDCGAVEGAWWDGHVDDAVRTNTLPRLVAELFAAIDEMHESADDAAAVRAVPEHYEWGTTLAVDRQPEDLR